MEDRIYSIELNWFYTPEGDGFMKFTIGVEARNNIPCTDIIKTDEGSYIILFKNGESLEMFNPNIIYRKPIDDEVFETKLNK